MNKPLTLRGVRDALRSWGPAFILGDGTPLSVLADAIDTELRVRPMSEAPKDGRVILVEANVAHVPQRLFAVRWNRGAWCCSNMFFDHATLLGWWPLSQGEEP